MRLFTFPSSFKVFIWNPGLTVLGWCLYPGRRYKILHFLLLYDGPHNPLKHYFKLCRRGICIRLSFFLRQRSYFVAHTDLSWVFPTSLPWLSVVLPPASELTYLGHNLEKRTIKMPWEADGSPILWFLNSVFISFPQSLCIIKNS